MQNVKNLIVGNWKMNGFLNSLEELVTIESSLSSADKNLPFEVIFCLPDTLIFAANQLNLHILQLGAQNCCHENNGAYTGDISAEQLKDVGASWVIIGHSERRLNHHETNPQIANKLAQAWESDLNTILCIGESIDVYEKGETLEFLTKQLEQVLSDSANIDKLTVAYEPIWSIGTGKIPTLVELDEIYNFIRSFLIEKLGKAAQNIRLLYGGSVTSKNAANILNIKDVNGLLVGKASLQAEEFLKICKFN
ncbi:triose-phosphate isomerase [Bartonella sp. DGB1]|uniref:triose-phosphate isomerase n=1 Tax=Bartonella sp. DGB1 TaxID=3239807 RepID=UPI0035262CF6